MGNYVLQIANYKLITHYQLSIELPQESVADAMNTERLRRILFLMMRAE